MAGHTKVPPSLHSHQNFSDGEDGPNCENGGENRPNGRVYSPDYMAPPCYQPPNPRNIAQGHYQQPYTARSTPHLTEPAENNETLNGDHRETNDQMDPPYYVQDLVKPRAHSEGKQLPEEYRGMVIGGDPPPYRQPPHNALPLRDSRFRSEYNSEPPGNLALPPSDYRQQYFSQTMSGVAGSARRFSPLRLPIGGSQWRICSWRICAITFLALSLCLAATTIYLAASQVTDWQENSRCGSGPSDILAPPSPSKTQKLPSQEHPSIRDSGNPRSPRLSQSQTFFFPLFDGELPSILLFPSMLPSSSPLAQEHRKWPNQEDDKVSFSALSLGSISSGVRMHGGSILDGYFATAIPVAPSMQVSISSDRFSNTYVVLLNYSPAKVVAAFHHTHSSRYSVEKHKVVHDVVRTNMFNYFNLRRHKRFVSDNITVTSSSTTKLVSLEPSSVFSKMNNPPILKQAEDLKANSSSYLTGNESSQSIISETTNLLKNLMSEPILKLRSGSGIVDENLHISEDKENAFRPLEDINLYANDIVNSEAKDKHPRLPSQATNEAENIKKTSLPVFSILNRVQNQNDNNIIDENNNNTLTDIYTPSLEPVSLNLDSTVILLPNTVVQQTLQSHKSSINEDETMFTSQLLKTHNVSKLITIETLNLIEGQQNLMNRNGSALINAVEDNSVLMTTPNPILTRESITEIAPTPVLKIKKMIFQTKLTTNQENSHSLAMSQKTNLSFDVTESMSKLNQATGKGHFQENTEIYQKVSSVNFPVEQKREARKESYNFEVRAKGLEVSNRIRKESPLESREKFKEAKPGHGLHNELNVSSSQEEEEERPNQVNSNATESEKNLHAINKELPFSSSSNHQIHPQRINESERGVFSSSGFKMDKHDDELNISEDKDGNHLSQINGKMAAAAASQINQKKRNDDKRGDPITIKEYDSNRVTQKGRGREKPPKEGKEEETKQNLLQQQQKQRQQPTNQYPLISERGKSPSSKSSIIPKEASENTREMLNEYSNSDSKIIEQTDDINTDFFTAASSVYASSASGFADSESIPYTDNGSDASIKVHSDATPIKSLAQHDRSHEKLSLVDDAINLNFTLHSSLKSSTDILLTDTHQENSTENLHNNGFTHYSDTFSFETKTTKNKTLKDSSSVATSLITFSNNHEEQNYKLPPNQILQNTEQNSLDLNLSVKIIKNKDLTKPIFSTKFLQLDSRIKENTIISKTPVNTFEQIQTISLFPSKDNNILFKSDISHKMSEVADEVIGKSVISEIEHYQKSDSDMKVFNDIKESKSDNLLDTAIDKISKNNNDSRYLHDGDNEKTETKKLSQKDVILSNNLKSDSTIYPVESLVINSEVTIHPTNTFTSRSQKTSSEILISLSIVSQTGLKYTEINDTKGFTSVIKDNQPKNKFLNSSPQILEADENIKTHKSPKNDFFPLENEKIEGDEPALMNFEVIKHNAEEEEESIEPRQNKKEENSETGEKFLEEGKKNDTSKTTATDRREIELQEFDNKDTLLNKKYEKNHTVGENINPTRENVIESKIELEEKERISEYHNNYKNNDLIDNVKGADDDENKASEENITMKILGRENRKNYTNYYQDFFEIKNVNTRDDENLEKKEPEGQEREATKNFETKEQQQKSGKWKMEKDKKESQDDHKPPLSTFRKSFDQHSENEGMLLSRDHNKESMQVTSGMETTSRVGSEDVLPESYAPIFRLENHYLRQTHIYPDQNKHQNETLQHSSAEKGDDVKASKSKASSSSLASDLEPLSTRGSVSIASSTDFNEVITTNLSSIDKNNDKNNSSFAIFASESSKNVHKTERRDKDHQEIIRNDTEERLSFCSCDCPCKKVSYEKIFENTSLTDNNTQSEDKQKTTRNPTTERSLDKEEGINKIGLEEIKETMKQQEYAEINSSLSMTEASRRDTLIHQAVKENLDNIKNHPSIPPDRLTTSSNSAQHRHRHHHGDRFLKGSKREEDCHRIPSNDSRDSPRSSSLPTSTDRDKLASITTPPSIQMTNQTSANSFPEKALNRKESKRDGECNHDPKMCKLKRKRERGKCSLGRKGCSAQKIAEYYLKLFGPKKTDSSQFYIVPILFGREINLTSWHWKSLQEPTKATGNSVPRPHQIAPPDGASFSVLILGETLTFVIPPYGYWNLHLTLSDTTELHLALTIPRGTSLGLYARRDALPTHTQHDLMKVLRGSTSRESRSSGGAVEVGLEEVLESGDWFLSLYNDDGDPHNVELLATPGSGSGECPQRCNERGHCFLGRCQCQTGYSGHDCSEVLCPILCNGRGEYVEGQCQCHPGWKGKECELKIHECEVPDCSGHGRCVDGECKCANGFTGEFCEKVDCPNPTCSGHGWCVRGTCVCDRGWRRPDCSQMDTEALQCLPDCNKHGTFDINTHSCICTPPWTGSDCSKETCSLDCGPHGKCENEVCQCEEGWTGGRCDERLCDPRCAEHGQCKNGTCICMTGWNGKHCTLPGCPRNCMGHGKCMADEEGQWFCKCHEEWEGVDCSVRLEMTCDDRIDNDDDGLMDCEDPECCQTPSCTTSQLCMPLPDPIDILLKMQPPAATASFYEKMQFIIQENSLQSFPGTFNKRRAAVIRGRVVTSAGRPIVGLRVSTEKGSDGVTMTRLDGMFDIMVNGGVAVTLRFGKSPFSPRQLQVVVPWNEFVVLDDIVMTVKHKPSNYRHAVVESALDQFGYNDSLQSSPCPQHDYDLLRPVIMSTWQNEFQGECPDVDAILVETQAVQESVQIPGTGLYLVYHSSRAAGYKSTLRFQLTPKVIPTSLRRVHLRIVLQGILYKKVFEADPLIKFTYSWDRNNVYKLRVYGTTVARISVGYEHIGCEKTIIWDHHTTKVAGYDLAISEMGGFNLHVHHAYNFHQGILQKGDGRNIHLAGQRHLVTTLLGTGEQREVVCTSRCEGDAHKSPLLAPTCLAAAPDGSLYVGDFNLIRRVTPEGKVFTVARLNETRVSYRYHVAVSPVTGKVYVSDPDAHQVLELQSTSDVKDPSRNVIPIVGSGQRCLPGDRNKCGDGGPAIHARLTYPKGLAISPNDDLYIADGTNIRIVQNKNIRTVIGGHDHRSHWAPVPCNGTIERDQLRLRWPTELAISPLDGSLHILDDHLVLRLTPDNRVQVLTGRPLHCPAPSHNPQHMSRAALLLAPQSIAFSLQGDLYIAESDTQRINRVRVITTSGHISTFAGADSRCNCRDRSCFCHTFDNVSATSAVFSLISAIAVTPDGILHISDQAGYRVRSVRSILPEPNDLGEYEIFSPDTHEVYVFNRFGKHMETRNLVTGQTIYKFTYNTNANTGKLSSVTDAASNSFKVIRRTYSKVTFIENPQKQRVTIRFTVMNNDLEKLEAPDGYNISFRYHSASGLIQSKMEGGGRTYSYEYDDQGRLVRAVLPTGEVIALNFDLSIQGAQVTATRDGEKSVTAIIRGNTITHKTDSVQAISEPRGEGGLRLVTAWDHEISLERTSYRVLETKSPTSAQMFPILSRQQTHIGKELVNRYDWTFSPAEHIYRHDGMRVSADLKVNGEDLLTLGYDPVSSSEALLSVSGEVLVNITYDKIGRPTKWMPLKPLVPTSVGYDDWGHVTLWKRGELSEEYEYDNLLRLASVTYGDNTTIRYEFREQLTKPERVTYPSGRSYGLVYDEAGALREVVTPKGSIYSLHLSTSLGFYRLRLALPSNTVVTQMRVDEQGRLVAVSHPNEEGILLYEYDLLGRLRNELYGHGYTEYTYLDSGLLRTARTRHANHDIRMDYSYHTGLAKKVKIRYGTKSNLHNVEFHYQYDESARLRVIEGEIKSNAIPELYLKYDNLTGSLLAVSDLRIIRNNILKTIIQNQKKYFVSTRILDNYGRISQEVISLQDRNVYMMHLKYDFRGRISEHVTEIFGGRILTNYKYMADGQILEANGGHTRLYTYDKNGNIVSFTDETRAEFLHYDECDRVIKAGDGDVEYDGKGYVIRFDNQNFEYNTKGQLIAGYSRDKSWSFTFSYDHLSRVSIYRDHFGNVTQIIYGRPDQPDLISHLHNPRTQATSILIYDDRNRLIAVDGPQGRLFVATDQNGAPIAFFDDNGSLIRRQRWTPFGRIADSAGTQIWVGVGPWGGLLEPITGIIVLKGYAYNPRLLQWMTPRWDKLTRATRQVTDVFAYRFRNNDPINPPEHLDYHFNDVSDWLRVMGIELSKVLGSEYQGYMLERPKPSINVSALADSEVVSGLWCQYKASINHLQDLSFFSRSHIQRHVGAWKGAPISHQSYVFGPGVLVSNVNGRALVTYIPMVKDGSSVIGNVIRTVLNNSLILDVSSTENGKDTFYFIKEEKKRASGDKTTLERLSGIYNVTQRESHDGLENHVVTPTANIIIFYNKRVDKARNRILTQLEVRAEEAAWAREATLVANGRPGTRPWEPSEIEELISKGRVSRYVARHVHSSNKYPLLAADPSNILFKHESSRKRRKSRRKGRKKGWRRRNKKEFKKDTSELDT